MFVFLCPDMYLMAQASASELRVSRTPGQCHPPYTLGMPAVPHSHGAGGFCQQAPSTLSHRAEVVLWQPGLLLSISRAPESAPVLLSPAPCAHTHGMQKATSAGDPRCRPAAAWGCSPQRSRGCQA